ncbi:head-tail connector protein [Pseudochelatococcus sp. B33]
MLTLVTPPAVEPVSVEEARAALGLPSSVSGLTIGAALVASRQALDGKNGWLHRALISQTWDLTLDDRPGVSVCLPLPPVQSIVSVSTWDGAAWVEFPSTEYRFSAGIPDVVISRHGWPAGVGPRSFRVRYVAGYGDAPANVPQAIRQAIILRARPIITSMTVDPALQRERVDGVGEFQWGFTAATADVYEKAAASLLDGYRVPVL